jgi:PAS domain S-box-containing protein
VNQPAFPRSLSILLLEDSDADQLLIRNELRAGGVVCEIRPVKSRAEFSSALQETRYDLILSDYTLPSYDGAAALVEAKARQPETPFIYVSGTLGEERAVESVRGGATDYVLKGRLERLVPAVKRALREAREQRARRDAEAKYQSIFENASEGIFQASPEGRLLTVNPALARLCGYDSPEALMKAAFNLADELYVNPARRTEIQRLLRERGEVAGVESQIRRRDGRIIWVSENIRAVRGTRGSLLYCEGTMVDITPRKEAVEALRHSEERFREMAETIHDVFWVGSPGGRQLDYVSPAYDQIWGRSRADLLTNPAGWLESILPADRGAVQQACTGLAAGTEYRVQYRINRPDGALCWIEERGYPVYDQAHQLVRTVGTASAITERKHLEAQLLQSQKMEAIGQLAGGVAHDFNNVLTIINGYSRLLLDQGQLPAGVEERVRQIYSAGIRAGNLIRQLLLFSRKHAFNRQPIPLNHHVEEIAKLIRRLIGEDIRLELHLAPELPPVNADAGMMEQVLMNLAVNARDAMPKGGPLTVTTTLVRLDAAKAAENSLRRTGEFVCLAMRDTGTGIPPEVLPRIFEPFFTTKAAGVGTGLGLASVFGIVQQHEGWLEVESAPGAGTCFQVFLPRAAEPAAEPGKSIHPFAGRGSETILLVEDEAPVRELVVAVLEHFGYHILQAGSGIQALEVWKWQSTRVDLLLTDLVMPDGMTGADLAKILQAEKPRLKVIFTSGYSGEGASQGLDRPAGMPFLQKPYLPAKLASFVREVLDADRPQPRN